MYQQLDTLLHQELYPLDLGHLIAVINEGGLWCMNNRTLKYFKMLQASARPATNRRNAMKRAEANTKWSALH
jgi:hypothetical protein